MNFQGLSLDQAPPVDVPFRFFLLAPIFASIAGLLALYLGADVLQNRFDPRSIAVVHLITVGFFGLVMLGALTQMMPVIAGAVIKRVRLVGGIAHFLMVFGLLAMVFAFFTLQRSAFLLSAVSLVSGFVLLMGALLFSFKGVGSFTSTLKGVILSLLVGVFVVFVGAELLFEYFHLNLSALHVVLANIHAASAVFGFATLLFVAVSFQVLPMFYVTQDFSTFVQKQLPWFVVAGLVVWGVKNAFFAEHFIAFKLFFLVLFALFFLSFLQRIASRKRKINDVTLNYFRFGAVVFILGLALWLADEFTEFSLTFFVALLIGAALLAFMSAMLYKIIPFLVWFHLNAKGYMSIPTMGEMIPKKNLSLQFYLFVLSFAALCVGVFLTPLFQIGAFLFAVSMLYLEYNIIIAVRIYRKTLKTKPDFDMSLMGQG